MVKRLCNLYLEFSILVTLDLIFKCIKGYLSSLYCTNNWSFQNLCTCLNIKSELWWMNLGFFSIIIINFNFDIWYIEADRTNNTISYGGLNIIKFWTLKYYSINILYFLANIVDINLIAIICFNINNIFASITSIKVNIKVLQTKAISSFVQYWVDVPYS